MKYLDFLVEKMVLFYVQIDFSAGNGWTGKHRSEDWCRREPTQRPSLHETNWMPMTIRNSITWKLADAPCASALQGDSNPWWWNHGTDSIRIAVHTALRGTYSKNMKIHLAESGRPSRMSAGKVKQNLDLLKSIHKNWWKGRCSLQHRASPSRFFLALPFKEKWWWWDN